MTEHDPTKPLWELCGYHDEQEGWCTEYLCNQHGRHAHLCACPDLEVFEAAGIRPWQPGSLAAALAAGLITTTTDTETPDDHERTS